MESAVLCALPQGNPPAVSTKFWKKSFSAQIIPKTKGVEESLTSKPMSTSLRSISLCLIGWSTCTKWGQLEKPDRLKTDVKKYMTQDIQLGPISQRDLSPDLDLNLRLWS